MFNNREAPMKPTIGRTILVKGIASNGSNIHPAIVTRVWSDADPRDLSQTVLVNATVFPDSAPPVSRGSIRMLETEAEAEAVTAGASSGQIVAFWPPRHC